MTPSGGNRYVALNTREPPFDDINVRKAVIANSDRAALRATRGGALSATIATHFIPPGVPGFEEAGGVAGPQGSEFDFVQNPKGDPRSGRLVHEEGRLLEREVRGRTARSPWSATTRRPGATRPRWSRTSSSSWASTSTSSRSTTTVMYTKFCDVPENSPDVCPNVGWARTSTTRSPSSIPRSTARRSCRRTTPTGRCSTTSRSTRRSDEADDDQRPRRAGSGVGQDRRRDHRRWLGDPVALGQPGEHRVGGRARRDQPVQLELRTCRSRRCQVGAVRGKTPEQVEGPAAPGRRGPFPAQPARAPLHSQTRALGDRQ